MERRFAKVIHFCVKVAAKTNKAVQPRVLNTIFGNANGPTLDSTVRTVRVRGQPSRRLSRTDILGQLYPA